MCFKCTVIMQNLLSFQLCLDLIMGASGPGSYGQWELCSNGTVIIGIKEKVYQDGASALNGVKLRCSNYIDVISAEGKDGEYSNVFLYCNLGFSHARLAIRVGIFCRAFSVSQVFNMGLFSGVFFLFLGALLGVTIDKFYIG